MCETILNFLAQSPYSFIKAHSTVISNYHWISPTYDPALTLKLGDFQAFLSHRPSACGFQVCTYQYSRAFLFLLCVTLTPLPPNKGVYSLTVTALAVLERVVPDARCHNHRWRNLLKWTAIHPNDCSVDMELKRWYQNIPRRWHDRLICKDLALVKWGSYTNGLWLHSGLRFYLFFFFFNLV